VKKTSLYIEPWVDAALTRRAEAEGISKAELIRRGLRVVADGAPPPRVIGIGSIKGMPRDLGENDEYYLAESGFGQH
jgi:Ribbon-helix-helix protein, copG family